MKTRLDSYLQRAGLFESRQSAKAAIMEGLVTVDGATCKPGTQVRGDEDIRVDPGAEKYVSRGGAKLEGALDSFQMDVTGQVVLDVGASTGGFTDCLLRRGAVRVVAMDVGRGQVHWKLRNDPRVTVVEGFNAKYLKPGSISETPAMATIDVSFISLKKIIGPVFSVIPEGGEIVALVKPQFEVDRQRVGKGGVVRDPQVHREVLASMVGWLKEEGFSARGIVASPLRGPKGNIEFFIHIVRGTSNEVEEPQIEEVVRGAHARSGRKGNGVD